MTVDGCARRDGAREVGLLSNTRCLIGVDAGTSVVKAVAFDYAGKEICASETPLSLSRPEPLWIEQDMEMLWQTVKIAYAMSIGA